MRFTDTVFTEVDDLVSQYTYRTYYRMEDNQSV